MKSEHLRKQVYVEQSTHYLIWVTETAQVLGPPKNKTRRKWDLIQRRQQQRELLAQGSHQWHLPCCATQFDDLAKHLDSTLVCSITSLLVIETTVLNLLPHNLTWLSIYYPLHVSSQYSYQCGVSILMIINSTVYMRHICYILHKCYVKSTNFQ